LPRPIPTIRRVSCCYQSSKGPVTVAAILS